MTTSEQSPFHKSQGDPVQHRYHYQFVVSRSSGLTPLGEGTYPYPLSRGEIIQLIEETVGPDGQTPIVLAASYAVEQVVHAGVRVLGANSPGAIHSRPLPHAEACPTVYLWPLDESGRPLSLMTHGPVPGLVVSVKAESDS